MAAKDAERVSMYRDTALATCVVLTWAPTYCYNNGLGNEKRPLSTPCPALQGQRRTCRTAKPVGQANPVWHAVVVAANHMRLRAIWAAYPPSIQKITGPAEHKVSQVHGATERAS